MGYSFVIRALEKCGPVSGHERANESIEIHGISHYRSRRVRRMTGF
jgi:hypothetical protein